MPHDNFKGKSGAGPRGDQMLMADYILGKIMAKLDSLNITDKTLLIFTSDNGPREGVNGHKSAGKWRGYKGNIWEGGHRVPFIARWPKKIKPGTTSSETMGLMDMMATFAAVVGAQLPRGAGEDSYNMLAALLGKNKDASIRNDIIHHSGAGVFAIRQGDWKLIEETKGAGYHEGRKPGAPGQLYNLAEDPWEQNDLWEEQPEIVEKLTRLLNQYRNQGYSRSL